MSVKRQYWFPVTRIAGLEPDTHQERVADIASALGIGDVLAREPSQLSGGQRQRVAMGQAIVRRPALFHDGRTAVQPGQWTARTELRAEISALVRELGVTTLTSRTPGRGAGSWPNRVAIMRTRVCCRTSVRRRRSTTVPARCSVAAFLGSPRMNLLEASVLRAPGPVHRPAPRGAGAATCRGMTCRARRGGALPR